MRTIPFTLAVALAGAFARTAAETIAVPALPEPAFADTEVSEDFIFHMEDAAGDCLLVRMSLDAGTTNALSVAFGTDVMSHALFQPSLSNRTCTRAFRCGSSSPCREL